MRWQTGYLRKTPLSSPTPIESFTLDTQPTRYGISPDTSDTLDAGFRHKGLGCPT